jgi:hypothetical protein
MTICFQAVSNSWKKNVSLIFFGIFSLILSKIGIVQAEVEEHTK